jgi:hypothetical protein
LTLAAVQDPNHCLHPANPVLIVIINIHFQNRPASGLSQAKTAHAALEHTQATSTKSSAQPSTHPIHPRIHLSIRQPRPSVHTSIRTSILLVRHPQDYARFPATLVLGCSQPAALLLTTLPMACRVRISPRVYDLPSRSARLHALFQGDYLDHLFPSLNDFCRLI